MKADDIKFDLYLKGLLGAESVISSDIDYSKLTYFNYGAFVGAAYYPWSKLGFYGEFGLGNKATDSKIRSLAHFGLSYRFGK